MHVHHVHGLPEKIRSVDVPGLPTGWLLCRASKKARLYAVQHGIYSAIDHRAGRGVCDRRGVLYICSERTHVIDDPALRVRNFCRYVMGVSRVGRDVQQSHPVREPHRRVNFRITMGH